MGKGKMPFLKTMCDNVIRGEDQMGRLKNCFFFDNTRTARGEDESDFDLPRPISSCRIT